MLADLFESIQKMGLEIYDLDPARFLTTRTAILKRPKEKKIF